MNTCNFIYSTEGAVQRPGGIEFPATKEQVVDVVSSSGGPEAVIVAANRLPDKTYQDFEELAEALEASRP